MFASNAEPMVTYQSLQKTEAQQCVLVAGLGNVLLEERVFWVLAAVKQRSLLQLLGLELQHAGSTTRLFAGVYKHHGLLIMLQTFHYLQREGAV